MSKRLMHLSIAILCLMLAYHLGARNVAAQAPGNPIVGLACSSGGDYVAVTANGDSYRTSDGGDSWRPNRDNIFGGPTPAAPRSFGQVKLRWDNNRAAPQQGEGAKRITGDGR